MLQLFYNDIYYTAISPQARFPRERYRLVYEALAQHNGDWTNIHKAKPATREQLLLVHKQEYVDAFLQGRLSDKQIRQIGFRPWSPDFVERTLTILGGSVSALHAAMRDKGIAGNLAGGTHHAYPDHGEGYCVFNDLAVCAVLARQEYGVERIAIVDCDVHQGNGTAAIFCNEPQVLTYSIHCEKNYPFHKEQSDIDVALPESMTDARYLERLQQSLFPALDEFEPELILFQAGCDALNSDRLGRLSLSRQGLRERNERVLQWADTNKLPVVIFMGGGYADPIEDSVQCHIDVYEQAGFYHARRTEDKVRRV